MNPFLSIRFITLTLMFILSIIISYFYAFNGIYPTWQWKNSANSISTQFSADEWFNRYPSKKGVLIVDLANYAISDLLEWEKEFDAQRPFMADGKLFMADNMQSLIYANQEGIYLSPDLGAHWQQAADISTLVNNFYPAEQEAGAQYIFASNGDQLTLWYNYAFAVGSLEIRLDLQTLTVLAHKWLPLRITQAYQYNSESVFLLAEEPSRKLNSILYYAFSNPEYQVIAETGYEKLNELIASKDYLIVQLGVGDNRKILIIDRESNQVRYRKNLNSSLFDTEQQYFIRFPQATDPLEETQKSSLSYQYAIPCSKPGKDKTIRLDRQ